MRRSLRAALPLIGLALAAAGILAAPAHAGAKGFAAQPAINGDRIVFASEGDLFTLTVPPISIDSTTEPAPIPAWRLTSGDGAESMPVISPDGRWVAFAGEYEGNTDVYLMPISGGSPTRLTYHPAPDEPLAFSPDGSEVHFRSPRSHPHGLRELWTVSVAGGLPERGGVNECTLLSPNPSGRAFAFTPWSNERWGWKNYRGGTAPEIWVAEPRADAFIQLTDDPANDLFPMWLAGRVYFISDRTGQTNIWSDTPRGGDLTQHTSFASEQDDPTAIEGYIINWASGDSSRGGRTIVFCQAGQLAIFDTETGDVRRLDVDLVSDRVAARRRYAPIAETLSEAALSPDGSTILLGARGEALAVDVETGTARQLTRTSGAREWGFVWKDEDNIALITDAGGEQQLALMPADGSENPSLLTQDREDWLFPPVASNDGRWLALADKTLRLHLYDMTTMELRQIDQGEAEEIRDYRFSPDSRWLAYTVPLPTGMNEVRLYAIETGRTFTVGRAMDDNQRTRWDPAGKYLYYLSRRHFNPTMGVFDFEHVYNNTVRIIALPLASDTPAPLPRMAKAAGFDLEAWASGGAQQSEGGEDSDEGDEAEDGEAQDGGESAPAPAMLATGMVVDTDGMADREVLLPIKPGNYVQLEAIPGALLYVETPVEGLLDDDWPSGQGLSAGDGTLHRYGFADAEAAPLVQQVDEFIISRDRSTIAYAGVGGLTVHPVNPPGEAKPIDLSGVQIRVSAADEWRQIFEEAWRLQRDFYWAPNMAGLDWDAMKERYAALLPRIGSRTELNELIKQMIGELGTSHTYIWGGALHPREEAQPMSVGLLGADLATEGGAVVIERILPPQPYDQRGDSPLAASHLNIEPGAFLLAIDGQPIDPRTNPYELLQDRAGKLTRLTIADDARGANNRRDVTIEPTGSESRLRYLAWVDQKRREVADATDGKVGYIHIPNMGGPGLSMFSRQFFPQWRMGAIIVDDRYNAGGFVSQMILRRLDRDVLSYDQPRHGAVSRYPYRAPDAHYACLINEQAGSDGDIFPASFRRAGLGPLIGTRTWGGVVGIRGDKPFVDLGLSTQPEFAYWDERGWVIENEGVRPDIEVELTPADSAAERDPQLQRAIEHLLEKLEEDPKEQPTHPPFPER